MFQRDFLMRELKRILDGITAALRKNTDGDTSLALDTLGGLYEDVLQEQRTLLDHTDARTMAALLGTPERVAALAFVLGAEAEVRKDETTKALMLRAKATELLLEAVQLGFEDDGALARWAVPDAMLSERAKGLRSRRSNP